LQKLVKLFEEAQKSNFGEQNAIATFLCIRTIWNITRLNIA